MKKKCVWTVIKTIVAGGTMPAALVLSGCGGSSSSELGGSQSGELAIELIDGQGDLVSYTVTVSVLELTRANGAVVDSDGNAFTTLEVTVNLEEANRLVIAAGVPASLTLEFGLAASNTVTLTDNGDATVTVEPFMIAELEPQAPKLHRVRGALDSVDTANDEFAVIVRSFAHAVSGADAAFGT